MSEHSPEPWRFGHRRGPGEKVSWIRGADGLAVLDTETDQNWFPKDDDLRRIVACVNVLHGVPTEVLESLLSKESRVIEDGAGVETDLGKVRKTLKSKGVT